MGNRVCCFVVVEFVVGSLFCSMRFFSSSQKPAFSNYNSIWKALSDKF